MSFDKVVLYSLDLINPYNTINIDVIKLQNKIDSCNDQFYFIAIKVNMPPTKHHMVIKHWSSVD
jgi:hypothetical protein